MIGTLRLILADDWQTPRTLLTETHFAWAPETAEVAMGAITPGHALRVAAVSSLPDGKIQIYADFSSIKIRAYSHCHKLLLLASNHVQDAGFEAKIAASHECRV